jgi:alkylated DNA repair protein (DNA oxidative demethylase)
MGINAECEAWTPSPCLQTGVPGLIYWPNAIDRDQKLQICDAVVQATAQVPFVRPRTPSGKSMSVSTSAMGRFGWWSDLEGYRYLERRPGSPCPWLPIPQCLIRIWRGCLGGASLPDSCLINHYEPGAKMGLHRDEDEADLEHPVLSISLGATARFRIGGAHRTDPTRSLELRCGDILAMTGPARLAYHGVSGIKSGTSSLVPDGGRFNLTLRVSGGGR